MKLLLIILKIIISFLNWKMSIDKLKAKLEGGLLLTEK